MSGIDAAHADPQAVAPITDAELGVRKERIAAVLAHAPDDPIARGYAAMIARIDALTVDRDSARYEAELMRQGIGILMDKAAEDMRDAAADAVSAYAEVVFAGDCGTFQNTAEFLDLADRIRALPLPDQHAADAGRDFLRRVVDVAWQAATESAAVPSTDWADRIIAKAWAGLTQKIEGNT